LIEHADVTGFGIDEVRVFSAARDTCDFDFVPADFLRDGAEVRERRDNVERGVCGESESEESGCEKIRFMAVNG
jgi:hypothetical protein